MTSEYAKAYEAATGSPPPGFTGVKASDQAGVKGGVPTPAPTAAPTPTPPVPTPPTPTPPAPPAEEEEGDNTGMIVGIIVGVLGGVAILGGVFYMYKKKKAAE